MLGHFHIERFFIPGLAHTAYIVTSGSEAVVVDPERNVEDYVVYIAKHRLKLIGIFLTHPHADFIAGHVELSARSGAPILISEKASATFDHCDVREGDRISVGLVNLEVIETPGHSPDSISLCLFDSGIPVALFSGDTLFAGDVGRPDLRGREIGSKQLASMLYSTLFDKLLKLSADVKIYPAHGAGSLCGRKISSALFTTIGEEAVTNWALQLNDRTNFIEAMVANLPERPPYFERSVAINLRGAPFLSDRPKISRLQFPEFKVLVDEGATILDVRPAALFADAHAVGSLNIGVASPSFPVWSGFLLNFDLPILLVVDDEGEAELAKLHLARIGFDHIAGFLVAEDLHETVHSNQLEARDLRGVAGPDCPIIVDVRSTQEYDQEHLEGTINIPLPSLLQRAGEFSRDTPLALLCASGYRSSIATSLLESEGFTRASNVMGGMDAIDLNCGDDLLWPRSSPPPLFQSGVNINTDKDRKLMRELGSVSS